MLNDSWQTRVLNTNIKRSRQSFLYFNLLIGFILVVGLAVNHIRMGEPFPFEIDILMTSPFILLLFLYWITKNLTITTDLMLSFFLLSIIPGFIWGGDSNIGVVYSVLFPPMVCYLMSYNKGRVFIVLYLLIVTSVPFLQYFGWIETTQSLSFILVLLFIFYLVSIFSLFQSYRIDELVEHLDYHVHFDPVTGFYNRHKLIMDLESRGYKAMILVNADNFKEINDVLGFRTGDKIIKAIGLALEKNVSTNGIYRLSGSEFALLQFLSDGVSVEEVRLISLIQSILFDISLIDFQEGKVKIPISVSIGAAFDKSGVGSDLINRCDRALKEGKKSMRKFCFYHPEFENILDDKRSMKWDNQIESAFKENRIVPFYQPILDTKTEEIVRYECLVRLIDKNGAVHLPGDFLSIVRKKRLYPSLTRAVFRHAVHGAYENKISVSVNISEEDILDPFTRDYFFLLLEQMSVGPLLLFEILETREIHDKEMLNRFLDKVRQFGCQVAIDDFGSGYSNWDYLAEIKADYVKIDGNIIKEIDTSLEKRMLVENIVALSRNLGIETVAEHVHSKEIFRIVKELGIGYAQGHFLGKPIPINSLNSSLLSVSALPK
jgi:diguanylate cyclase (GGDEF)-like protein